MHNSGSITSKCSGHPASAVRVYLVSPVPARPGWIAVLHRYPAALLMEPTTRLRLVDELRQLLRHGNAHVPLAQACADLPAHLLNRAVPDLPYTLWQLVEHIRITQWDVVEFCLNPAHVSPSWPVEYWPAPDVPGSADTLRASLTQIAHDRDRFLAVLDEPAQELFAPLPQGTGQTLFREAVLIADHTAYHTGQIILVRRLFHNWA